MRAFLYLCVLALCAPFSGCSSTPTIQGSNSMSESNAHPRCTTMVCLKENDSQVIQLEGQYIYPKQRAFAVTEVELSDGTIVIVSAKREGVLGQENDGRKVLVQGRIFPGDIPEKYQIFGRRPDPYLLDVTGAELL